MRSANVEGEASRSPVALLCAMVACDAFSEQGGPDGAAASRILAISKLFQGFNAAFLGQRLYLEFGFLQCGLAAARQLDATFELFHGVFQRQLTGLHALDQGL